MVNYTIIIIKMLLINEIKLTLNEPETKIRDKIAKKLRTSQFAYEIYRISLDCRKEIFFTYSVLVTINNEEKYLKINGVSKYEKSDLSAESKQRNFRPIVIGYGPSGIFCTYRLIEAGFKPLVFERGPRINKREKDVDLFFKEGILNPDSNIQYGEGGAGTFSDAKLTTRIKDRYVEYILNVFVEHGARKDIKYKAHAHIGTDEIRKVITNITDDLIQKGAEFHFEEEVTDFIIEDNICKAIITRKDTYYSDAIIVGAGHSAYNTVKKLYEKGVAMEAKDMAIGFRVEHPQSLIDNNQYHGVKHEKLEPSEYFLRYKDTKGVYSFCMCPGGEVVPATSDKNRVVTNGMSYADRGSGIANSAILVQVNKEEYPDYVLGGFDYLKDIEESAYSISQSFKALSQNIKDYLNNEVNDLIRTPSYSLGTVNTNLNDFFTAEQNSYFHKALKFFDDKIPGFIENGIMIAPETRSSCPIRINRKNDTESINIKNLYPMGEGAGFGGGIMSCALDGIRVANSIIDKENG